MNGRTNERTGIPPVFYRTSSPSGPLPKRGFVAVLGSLGATPGGPHRHGIFPAYNFIASQVLTCHILTLYLRKRRFYAHEAVFDAVLGPQGATPGGPQATYMQDLSIMRIYNLIGTYIPNFKFLSPKI